MKTQFEIVMFLKPPFDSVPNLIRPVGPSRSGARSCVRLKVPSRNEPTSKPLTSDRTNGLRRLLPACPN